MSNRDANQILEFLDAPLEGAEESGQVPVGKLLEAEIAEAGCGFLIG